MIDRAFTRAPREEIFAWTGNHFMRFNTFYQLLTLDEITDLIQARQIVAGMDKLKLYQPQGTAIWQSACERYQEIVAT